MIHHATGLKADFYPSRRHRYWAWAWEHRRSDTIEGQPASPTFRATDLGDEDVAAPRKAFPNDPLLSSGWGVAPLGLSILRGARHPDTSTDRT